MDPIISQCFVKEKKLLSSSGQSEPGFVIFNMNEPFVPIEPSDLVHRYFLDHGRASQNAIAQQKGAKSIAFFRTNEQNPSRPPMDNRAQVMRHQINFWIFCEYFHDPGQLLRIPGI